MQKELIIRSSMYDDRLAGLAEISCQPDILKRYFMGFNKIGLQDIIYWLILIGFFIMFCYSLAGWRLWLQ